MPIYHTNVITEKVEVCKALPCPHGFQDEHYTNKKAANHAYQQQSYLFLLDDYRDMPKQTLGSFIHRGKRNVHLLAKEVKLLDKQMEALFFDQGFRAYRRGLSLERQKAKLIARQKELKDMCDRAQEAIDFEEDIAPV